MKVGLASVSDLPCLDTPHLLGATGPVAAIVGPVVSTSVLFSCILGDYGRDGCLARLNTDP